MKRQREDIGAEVDVDHGFLDQVLNKLYDFGGEGKRSAKLKKRKGEEDDLNEKLGGGKAGLGHVTVAAGDDAVPATGSSSKTPAPVEVVTFLDPRKKKTTTTTSKRVPKPGAKPPEVKDEKKDADEGLTIEKARMEVHRFGITGFHKQQQRVFEQDRAIMLGARPPKKEYVNYRVYQEMISEKKLKDKEESLSSLKSNAHRQKKKKPGRQKTEKRKGAPSGREPTGLMGRFKDGVLLVNSRDIQKMNSKRRK